MNISINASKLPAAAAAQAAQSTAQEAMETAAVTKAEAAKGDPQAILKLARQAAAQSAPAPQPTAPAPNKFKSGFEALA